MEEQLNGQEREEEIPEIEASDTRRFPRYVYNPISLSGAALAIAMFFAIVIVFIVDATQAAPNPYIGIIGFAILPIPLILGLLLIPFGMWIAPAGSDWPTATSSASRPTPWT